jgi:AcrR family transcriptional regulator
MTSPGSLPFERARSPEQRRDRLSHLTDVTRQLLEQSRAATLTLGQVGAAAGLAKSGVLRYVGSREALLLRVMYLEHLAWIDALEKQLAEGPQELAKELASALAERPVLCDLIGTAPALISRLSSSDELVVRAQARDIEYRLGQTLEPQFALKSEALKLLVAAIHAFAGTAWAWTSPGPDGSTAFIANFEDTVAELLQTFIAGLGQ